MNTGYAAPGCKPRQIMATRPNPGAFFLIWTDQFGSQSLVTRKRALKILTILFHSVILGGWFGQTTYTSGQGLKAVTVVKVCFERLFLYFIPICYTDQGNFTSWMSG